jgi:hypothetical protein
MATRGKSRTRERERRSFSIMFGVERQLNPTPSNVYWITIYSNLNNVKIVLMALN